MSKKQKNTSLAQANEQNWDFVEVSSMRTIISIVIIIIAAVIGFFMGTGMNQAMGGATLFATVAGFACAIQAIESKKKP